MVSLNYKNLPYKEYRYSNLNVNIGGVQHTAAVVENHSTIDSIIYTTKNENFCDGYANIPRWHTTCIVKWKGKNSWETLHDGPSHEFRFNGEKLYSPQGIGLFPLLFALESGTAKQEYLRKQEISTLHSEISEKQRRLEELLNHHI